MNLHVFNPEHEMALALDGHYLNLPHNIQELRMNLGWLPALWADDGDVVMVDDKAFAIKARAKCRGVKTADVLFLEDDDLRRQTFDNVLPWGWDAALLRRLSLAGITADNLPDREKTQAIRQAAGRRTTIDALQVIRQGLTDVTCGSARYARSVREALGDDFIDSLTDSLNTAETEPARMPRPTGPLVVKAPWSSSGRGIRYIDGCPNANTLLWMANVIRRQGGVMVEPYYDKVKDFAMEFVIHNGVARYLGLSLFINTNGAYTGNLIATEEEKMSRLGRYLPGELLGEVAQRICRYAEDRFATTYEGPFGVDMMVVATKGDTFLLHPCVEINLRRTMGHVALALQTSAATPTRVMRIVHDVNYRLTVSTPGNNFVHVI